MSNKQNDIYYENLAENNDESFGTYCDNCHTATGNCDCPKGSCPECDDYREN